MERPKEANISEPTQKAEEFLLEVRKYLETVISLSEKKLNKNKENLKTVEHILRTKFNRVKSEETTQDHYS